jgi:UDP-N-acetylmuramate dehydrogenase
MEASQFGGGLTLPRRERLAALVKGEVRFDEPMAEHTTWRIGGPADAWVRPQDVEEVKRVVEWCTAEEVPYLVLGKGANVLVADQGISGVVLDLSWACGRLERQGLRVRAGAGVLLSQLASRCGQWGLTGLEFACGIPGTVGGAVTMNAGAHGSDFSRVVRRVSMLEEGQPRVRSLEEMDYAYRHSCVGPRTVVLEAELELAADQPSAVQARMKRYKQERNAAQPVQYSSAGSVFKNPPGTSAWAVVEAVGGRGLRRGAAEVSWQHANFIINHGGARAADVMALIRELQERARQQLGIELQVEVRPLGRWPEAP